MNRFALQLLAATTAAALALSAVHASESTWRGENDEYYASTDDTPVYVPFEQNFPASDGPDAALLSDLPVDYYTEPTLPTVSDFGDDAPPLMIASLDPLEAP